MTLADLAERIGDHLDRGTCHQLPARLGARVRLREVHVDHVVVSAPHDVLIRLSEALSEERAP